MAEITSAHRVAPASYAQESIWFADQVLGQEGAYNSAHCLRLHGQLDVAVLRSALSDLVARHSVLRTTFRPRKQGLQQLIYKDMPLNFATSDLSEIPADRLEICRQYASREFLKDFDLTAGPLMRAYLYRLSVHDHVLMIVMHHLLSDQWSGKIIFADLKELYRARVQNEKPLLASLDVDYADYAIEQRQILQGQFLEELLSYWRTRLSGAQPALALPASAERRSGRSSLGSQVELPVEVDLVDGVVRIARQERVTPFVLYLAALRTLLWRETGQSDLLIGVDIAERDEPELENLVGFFINKLLLRNPLDGMHDFREILSAERDTVMEAFAHKELPYIKLVEALRQAEGRTKSWLPDVIFSYSAESRPENWHMLESESFALVTPISKFDLEVSVERTDSRAAIVWSFNNDIYEQATISAVGERFKSLLHAIVNDPEALSLGVDVADKRVPSHSRELVSSQTADRARVPEHGDHAQPSPEPDDGRMAGFCSELREAWRSVLGATPPDENCGFFESGGNSLGMVELLSAINEHFPNIFELIDLYEYPSIQAQARFILQATDSGNLSDDTFLSARRRLNERRSERRRRRDGAE